MPPVLRRFVLTAHVTFAVGWLGAVAGFLALAIVGLRSSKLLRITQPVDLLMFNAYNALKSH